MCKFLINCMNLCFIVLNKTGFNKKVFISTKTYGGLLMRIYIICVAPSEMLSYNMRKMHIFSFIPYMCKVLSGHLLSTDTFYSVQ